MWVLGMDPHPLQEYQTLLMVEPVLQPPKDGLVYTLRVELQNVQSQNKRHHYDTHTEVAHYGSLKENGP